MFTACSGDDDDDAIDSSNSDINANQLVGTWSTSNSSGGYEFVYQFWSDGCAYYKYANTLSSSTLTNLGSGHGEDSHSSYTWSYDSSTKTLATTISNQTAIGFYGVYEVLIVSDDSWTGRAQNGDNTYTRVFKRVTENAYNP